MEDEINDEPDKVEQKDKEGYKSIKTIRSELESVYKEFKITIARGRKNYSRLCYYSPGRR
jgi:hypothetical protein